MEIREYKEEDINEIIQLFYDTVHNVNAKDYTKEQLNVWADQDIDTAAWNTSFLTHYTLVVLEEGVMIGFGDIDTTGYLDRLYIHKDWQRQGIATLICERLEKKYQVEEIETHASITAKSFFENRGYKLLKEQTVERKGIKLRNYIMVRNQR